LDAADAATAHAAEPATADASAASAVVAASARAYLLIDGGPRWIWIVDEDVELL
jgi:hypothetical protein